MLVTDFICWCQHLYHGDITNIPKLSPTDFVSNIRHQHRFSRFFYFGDIFDEHPSTTLIKPYLCCKQPCMVHSTKIKALQCFSCKKSRVATIRMQKETVALHCHQCQYWNLVVVWPVSGQQLVVVLFYVRRALKEGFNVVR